METLRINQNDFYTVRLRYPYQSLNHEVLALLYQPLITSTSHSLYMKLFSEGQSIGMYHAKHVDLMIAMNLDLHHLQKAFQYLEGIGLLETYTKEQSGQQHFIYQLLPPITAQEFFSDDILTFLLTDILGEERVESLKQYFNITGTIPKQYQEVTSDFSESYIFSEARYKATPPKIIPKQPESQKAWSKDDEQWFEQFVLTLDDRFINLDNIKQHKALILSVKKLYGFSDDIFQQLIYQSINLQEGCLETGKLELLARRTGQCVNNQLIQSEERQQHEYSSSEQQELFQLVSHISPMELLKELKSEKNGIIMTHERFLLQNLSPLIPNDVFNLIIYYCLVMKQEKELNQKLVEKIVNHLKQDNALDLQSVWNRLPKLYEELTTFSSRPYQKSYQKKVMKPEWELEENHSETQNIKKIDEQQLKERQAELESKIQSWKGIER